MITGNHQHWERADAQIFWGEIAPCDHVVQIYEDEATFLGLLSGFVCGGIRNGDSVIVIATPEHITVLNENLRSAGFDPFSLRLKEQFIALDAHETLARFMVKGWPDEERFNDAIMSILTRTRKHHRQIRAFGEMVAILWAEDKHGAAIHLEDLWNRLCATNEFCLFCAYPRSGFTAHVSEGMAHVCNAHSRIIGGLESSSNEIFFQTSMPEARLLR